MRLRIASWNINSVRLRAEQVARFVDEQAPDVLCLQEIKCQEAEFPREAFAAMGLPHVKIAGQKGWHGVAIASRLPIEDAPTLNVCREGHARCVSGLVAGVEIQNFYVPAGGDTPDRALNPKFDHKLDFFESLTAEMGRRDPKAPLAIVGDLNVAPGEFDVWSHKQLVKVVSHTPIEVESLQRFMDAHGWSDIGREHVKAPERYYSWWSYRSKDWKVNDRGRRLDHMWASPELARQATGHSIHEYARDWEKPSDHVPLVTEFTL